MTIPFTKMNGAGNDFVVIDNRKSIVPDEAKEKFVEKVCNRRFSVGADGVIFIENSDSDKVDFRWDFYNSDGSTAEMCGNGARCAARYAVDNNIAQAPNLSFETIAGIINAEVGDETIKVKLTQPHDFEQGRKVDLDSASHTIDSINTGVPHAVLFSDKIDDIKTIKPIGSAIRFHKEFAPAGTNVNLVEITGKDSIKIRTYERGVEDETLACGTGATAAAILAAKREKVAAPVKVKIASGCELKIHFNPSLDNGFGEVILEGPAEVNFQGTLNGNLI